MANNKVLVANLQSIGNTANVEPCRNHDRGNLLRPYWINYEM